TAGPQAARRHRSRADRHRAFPQTGREPDRGVPVARHAGAALADPPRPGRTRPGGTRGAEAGTAGAPAGPRGGDARAEVTGRRHRRDGPSDAGRRCGGARRGRGRAVLDGLPRGLPGRVPAPAGPGSRGPGHPVRPAAARRPRLHPHRGRAGGRGLRGGGTAARGHRGGGQCRRGDARGRGPRTGRPPGRGRGPRGGGGSAQPGMTADVLGENKGTPVITISGAPVRETSGQLRMTTIEATSPDTRVTLPDVIDSWFGTDRAVMPRDAVYPSGDTVKEIERYNR